MDGLQLSASRLILLQEGDGYPEVANMALNQELMYLGVKALVIITGLAEVEAQHPALVNCVLAAVDKIKTNVGYSTIILAAPIPKNGSTTVQLKELFQFSKLLQFVCKRDPRLEFTKTGQFFYGPGGLYANLLDEQGLTNSGLSLLKRQLQDKLGSLGLCKV